MRDVVYHQYAQSFDDHWWSDHRRRIVSAWLSSVGITPDGTRTVLEIGSGAGTEHAYLRGYGPVTGVEINETGLSYCRKRGYDQLIAGDLNALDLPVERFDLVVDFHVLYHAWVEDPLRVLTKLCASLRPGGRLILTEPAHEALRRGHDDAVMAARRWSRRELIRLVEAGGFEVERTTGFLTLLVPAVVVSLLLDRLHPKHGEVDELRKPNRFIDGILRFVMSIERAVLRCVSLPTGTCWALMARRPP